MPVRVTEEILAALLPPYAARRAGRQAEREQAQPRAEEPQPGLQPPSELLGTWRGHAHTYQADLPLRLEVKADGDVHARLGTQLEALVNDVRLNEGRLTGRMVGDIGTPDANRRPYHLHLDLRLREAVLDGALIALSPPEARFGNALSHWAELKRMD